ncbi:MAG: CBS domain-containing protein [Actinomycetota bacterium]|nr:CBS domain-containing protein [Actinomycetota bacterium]
MRTLPDIELVPAAVRRDATFHAAAEKLNERGVEMIAVLDDNERVVGVFGSEELLRGLFPRYLGELHHTAFTTDDLADRVSRAADVAREPVEKHMRKAVIVDVDTSTIHVAERFLHCGFPALAVVAKGAFVGMLERATFCRAVMGPASASSA